MLYRKTETHLWSFWFSSKNMCISVPVASALHFQLLVTVQTRIFQLGGDMMMKIWKENSTKPFGGQPQSHRIPLKYRAINQQDKSWGFTLIHLGLNVSPISIKLNQAVNHSVSVILTSWMYRADRKKGNTGEADRLLIASLHCRRWWLTSEVNKLAQTPVLISGTAMEITQKTTFLGGSWYRRPVLVAVRLLAGEKGQPASASFPAAAEERSHQSMLAPWRVFRPAAFRPCVSSNTSGRKGLRRVVRSVERTIGATLPPIG